MPGLESYWCWHTRFPPCPGQVPSEMKAEEDDVKKKNDYNSGEDHDHRQGPYSPGSR